MGCSRGVYSVSCRVSKDRVARAKAWASSELLQIFVAGPNEALLIQRSQSDEGCAAAFVVRPLSKHVRVAPAKPWASSEMLQILVAGPYAASYKRPKVVKVAAAFVIRPHTKHVIQSFLASQTKEIQTNGHRRWVSCSRRVMILKPESTRFPNGERVTNFHVWEVTRSTTIKVPLFG